MADSLPLDQLNAQIIAMQDQGKQIGDPALDALYAKRDAIVREQDAKVIQMQMGGMSDQAIQAALAANPMAASTVTQAKDMSQQQAAATVAQIEIDKTNALNALNTARSAYYSMVESGLYTWRDERYISIKDQYDKAEANYQQVLRDSATRYNQITGAIPTSSGGGVGPGDVLGVSKTFGTTASPYEGGAPGYAGVNIPGVTPTPVQAKEAPMGGTFTPIATGGFAEKLPLPPVNIPAGSIVDEYGNFFTPDGKVINPSTAAILSKSEYVKSLGLDITGNVGPGMNQLLIANPNGISVSPSMQPFLGLNLTAPQILAGAKGLELSGRFANDFFTLQDLAQKQKETESRSITNPATLGPALINAPDTLYGFANTIQGEISKIGISAYEIVAASGLPKSITGYANVEIGLATSFANTLPFVLSLPFAAKWAITNPVGVPGKAVEIGSSMVSDIWTRELASPGSGLGTIAGMAIGGKVLGSFVPNPLEFVKVSRFELPIETPKGLPKTEIVSKGYSDILMSVKEEGKVTYTRTEPLSFVEKTAEVPIQYAAKYLGLYLDKSVKVNLGGFKTGEYYGGKVPLVGASFEPGGKLLSAMPDTSFARSVVEKAREIPGAKQVVGYLESSPDVLTGLRFGPESPRLFGRNVEPRISGAIDYLTNTKANIALQKLQATESIINPRDTEFVKAIIELRDITSSRPGLLKPAERFGEHPPVTMKPETFDAIRGYMDANANDLRLYGSLVGRTYLGEAGRSTLGDIDALITSTKAQAHAEAMWNIYLEKEFGKGSYDIFTTERIFKTKAGTEYTEVLKVATSKSGDVLSKLETGASQITGKRIMGLTPTGEHALDLHPIKELKYTKTIEGTAVKTISPEDLIWGKQTIGNPPIGTVIVRRVGTEAVVDVGGRIKDVYDTRSFAAKAAADAYLNRGFPTQLGQRLESSFKVLDSRIKEVDFSQKIGGYPEGITLERFMGEFKNPLESREITKAKFERLAEDSLKKEKVYSGVGDYEYFKTDYTTDKGLAYVPIIPISYEITRSYSPGAYSVEYAPLMGYFKPSDFSYGTSKASSSYSPKSASAYEIFGYSTRQPYSEKISYLTEIYNPGSPYSPGQSPYTPPGIPPYTPPGIPPYTPPYTPGPYSPKVPAGSSSTSKPFGGIPFLTITIPEIKINQIYDRAPRKKRVPLSFQFKEISPALTPKEILGEVESKKPFYRTIGKGFVRKVTPEPVDIINRVDVGDMFQKTRSRGIDPFFRAKTKKEGGPGISRYTPTESEVSASKIVGRLVEFPKQTRKKKSGFRFF